MYTRLSDKVIGLELEEGIVGVDHMLSLIGKQLNSAIQRGAFVEEELNTHKGAQALSNASVDIYISQKEADSARWLHDDNNLTNTSESRKRSMK